MGSKKPQRLERRRKADNAYKRALGLAPGAQLPAELGTMASAGAARGGRGAAQRRQARKHPIGEGHGARTVAPRRGATPVTGAKAQIVPCPRCLAPTGQPCRDQTGKAYSASHAARQHRAGAAIRRRPELAPQRKPRRPDKPAELSDAQQSQREVYRQQQAAREALTGSPTSKGRSAAVRVANAAGTAPTRQLAVSGVLDQAAKALTAEQAREVPCPKCRVPGAAACRTGKGAQLPEVHPQRRIARVRAVIARQRAQAATEATPAAS